jgi:hypothetical protein
MLEVLAYQRSALAWTQQRAIDFKIIDARDVDFALPQANGRWHRRVG